MDVLEEVPMKRNPSTVTTSTTNGSIMDQRPKIASIVKLFTYTNKKGGGTATTFYNSDSEISVDSTRPPHFSNVNIITARATEEDGGPVVAVAATIPEMPEHQTKMGERIASAKRGGKALIRRMVAALRIKKHE